MGFRVSSLFARQKESRNAPTPDQFLINSRQKVFRLIIVMEKVKPPPTYEEVVGPSKSQKNGKKPLLFEDKWSKFSEDFLTIKCFYFPTGQSKRVKICAIKGVYYQEQKFVVDFKCKGWGMSLSPCWWACDMARNLHSDKFFNVVIDNGESTYKGFTTTDVGKFLSVIRPHLPRQKLRNKVLGVFGVRNLSEKANPEGKQTFLLVYCQSDECLPKKRPQQSR
ncbi:unnamed protein product [Caenorhabditis auriculariae]|uniref:Uncharacterized protein n=1 Tax=Caenorhabditis auriculariae TaxID=2777116 RepID=A0A8S1GUV7_9PELO|nr:unnamed protein product [Caenorhabditis auriculariae]